MTEATITSKGQITIPKEVRDRLKLEEGDKVYFDVGDDGAVRMTARNRPMEELFGLLKRRA